MITTSQFIDIIISFHLAAGRPPKCDYISWLESMRNSTPQQLVVDGFSHNNWQPMFCVDGIGLCHQVFGASALRDELHAIHIAFLASKPFPESRTAIEMVFWTHCANISEGNLGQLITALEAGHQNTKAFLSQQAIFQSLPHMLRSRVSAMEFSNV